MTTSSGSTPEPGGGFAYAPRMSFEGVLAHIHRAPVLAGMDRMQPDMRMLATELLERFALKQEAPLAASVEGAAFALWGMDWRTDPSPAFLEWYRSTGGVARALEVLLAALAYERRSYEWDSSIWALRRARPAQGLANLGVRPWLWMRRAMDEASKVDRAAAAEVANRASRAWHVRAALAFVFPDDESRWTPADRAELRHADVDHDDTAVRFGVLAAMRNARLDHAKLAQNYQIGEAIGPAEIAKSPDAVAALRLSRRYGELAALGDPDGLRALLELADADEAHPVIAKLSRTAATIAALAPMFTSQRPRRLLGLHLAHGFLAELVTAGPDEAARVEDPYITRLLVDTGARLPADAGWVSPWAKPVNKAKKPKADAPSKAAPLRDVGFLDRIHWDPGEREHHAQLHERAGENMDAEIAKRTLAMAKADKAFASQLVWVGDETALELWKAIEPAHWYAQTDDLEHLLARFGQGELDSILAFVRTKPDTMAALARVESPKVAPLMARGFALVKKMERVGRTWLEEYPEAAALGLLRDLDGDKQQRAANAKALAHVASKFATIVERVSSELGVDATELAAAGAPQLPGRAPKLPDFLDLASLPRPIADGVALQGPGLGEFLQLLAATLPGGQPALDAAAARYTEASLSRFSWSVFRQWLFAGAPPKHKWAMYAVGRFPDDANAKALGRLARVWAPRGNSARAQEAVEVLATMRTQAGLIEIHEVATKVQSKALQARAETVFETVATSLGLGTEELADRLVPELAEADLTFGDLRATFDASLVPSLVTADGSIVEKPRDTEDQARWKALGKMCKTVARTQLARLEQLLADGHRLPYAHFSEIYLMHSLIRHLARGLVWGAYREGQLAFAFAITVDGPVGLDGKPRELAIDATYGVAHPVELPDLAAWKQRLPEQPIAQLERDVFPADSGMEVSLILAKLISRVIQTGKLMELQRRGWRRGESPQGGRYYSIDRAGKGWTAELAFTPGIYLGNPVDEPTQALEAVAFFAEPDVPKAVLSEIQREVRGLLVD